MELRMDMVLEQEQATIQVLDFYHAIDRAAAEPAAALAIMAELPDEMRWRVKLAGALDVGFTYRVAARARAAAMRVAPSTPAGQITAETLPAIMAHVEHERLVWRKLAETGKLAAYTADALDEVHYALTYCQLAIHAPTARTRATATGLAALSAAEAGARGVVAVALWQNQVEVNTDQILYAARVDQAHQIKKSAQTFILEVVAGLGHTSAQNA